MILRAETMAMIVITFALTVGLSYLWGYGVGKKDSACYVTTSD